jgi:hypothetical protein
VIIEKFSEPSVGVLSGRTLHSEVNSLSSLFATKFLLIDGLNLGEKIACEKEDGSGCLSGGWGHMIRPGGLL